MDSYFQRIDPLCKIIFVISQLVFLYVINNMILRTSVIIIFTLVNFSNLDRIKSSCKNFLNITPLLLSFFLLGFLFGNPLNQDLKLVLNISLLAIYTFWLIDTTSSFNLLSSLRRFLPSKDSSIIIFCYDLIFFFPQLQNIIKNTVTIYRYQVGSLRKLNRMTSLFITILEKTVVKARNHHGVERFLESKVKPKLLSKFDFSLIAIISAQLFLTLL